jgi:glycosyltransferase involved in cell wall biosynthesis
VRIAHIVPSYLPGHRYGGPIASVHGLSRALVQRGHEVDVWTTDMDEGQRLDVPLGERVEIDGVDVRYFQTRGPARVRWAPEFAGAFERAVGDYDLVQAHGVFVATTSRALSMAQRAGVPTVLSPRGMLMSSMLEARGAFRKRWWLRQFDERNLRGLVGLHLTAEAERRELPNLGFRWTKQVAVIENGVEPASFDGDWTALREDVAALCTADARFLLFLSRVHWKKGLDRLTGALARLPEDIHLAVAGPDEGYGNELRHLIRQHGLESRVQVLGAVRGADKAALLEHAAALALPSYSENFGNVVLEAMAAGCPPVITPEVGAAEVVRRERSGWVVPGSPEHLSRTLSQLLNQPRLRAEAARLGRQAVEERYTWPSIAARMEAFYGELLGRSELRAA